MHPLHGISFIAVDNTALQSAIASGASSDYVSSLKQSVAFNAVYGFQYDELPFDQLGNILNHDYGFSPFKYTDVLDGAIYNTEKHPNAWGGVRGKYNVKSPISWVCLDIDSTTITDDEIHLILTNVNHHIARTSNPSNPCKYRIILELSTPVLVPENAWKLFIKSIATSLGLVADSLGRSQVFYGYLGRNLVSTIDATPIDPSTHLNWALVEAEVLEEKRASALSPVEASTALQSPYYTFHFAYEARPGEGTNMLLGAISKATELGASREYIIDLVHAINTFWDHSMPIARLQSTVLTAI